MNFEYLEQLLSKLSIIEMEVLEILSIRFSSVAPGDIQQLVAACRCQSASTSIPGPDAVKDALSKLLRKDLMLKTPLGLTCNPLITEIVIRKCAREERFKQIDDLMQRFFMRQGYSWADRDSQWEQLVRLFRRAVYSNDSAHFDRVLDEMKHYSWQDYRKNPILLVFNNPFDPVWFDGLSKRIQLRVLMRFFESSLMAVDSFEKLFAYFFAELERGGLPEDWPGTPILAEFAFLQGNLPLALKIVQPKNNCHFIGISALIQLLEGKHTEGIGQLHVALRELKKQTRSRNAVFSGIIGYFYCLAMIKEGSKSSLDEAEKYLALALKPERAYFPEVLVLFQEFLAHRAQARPLNQFLFQRSQKDYSAPFANLFFHLVHFWITGESLKETALLETAFSKFVNAGLLWLATETAVLYQRLRRPLLPGMVNILKTRGDSQTPALVDLFTAVEPWQLTLDALKHLIPEESTTFQSEKSSRLIWYFNLVESHGQSTISLETREQTRKKDGDWTSGRRPLCVRGMATKLPDFYTEQDRKAVNELLGLSRFDNKTNIDANLRAMVALVGHPLVFDYRHPEKRLEILRGEPELTIVYQGNQLEISFFPVEGAALPVVVTKEIPNKIRVFLLKPEQQKLAELFGQRQLFPLSAREQILATIARLSPLVTIHSSIGAGEGISSGETVQALPQPRLLLSPLGTGLKAIIRTRPFGQAGPYFFPGKGGRDVFTEIEGKRLHAQRDLEQEVAAAVQVEKTCHFLEGILESGGELCFPEAEDSLELLFQLQEHEDLLQLEWHEGKKLPSIKSVSFQHLRLSLQSKNDWFEVSGNLVIDENQVMEFQQLLSILDKTPGRFVQIDEGKFLALTREFRKRLDEWRHLTEGSGTHPKFHRLATPVAEELFEDITDISTDQGWRDFMSRLRESENLLPAVPTTMTAELRDYQKEAFQWLCRIAHWGAGACLADDMGLGKTIEALTLILDRAAKGPTLVIAPTSVGPNWITETQRFAPTLKPVLFGTGDRKTLLDSLGPFDLLICTYGLLQQEIDMLREKHWETIILDEAQAIKNQQTQRSQAAMSLNGGFRMIMTGTPIENHLGELWNLFRFINPGLLGSLDKFNQRFGMPIQKLDDKQAQARLKRLVQPFILRRTKSQVLQELPPRTEITLQVELSPEETAMYEAFRRQAVDKLSAGSGPSGQKHIQILAEIMKLRRFCCNPKLVAPDSGIQGAKLIVLTDLITELLENRHKALVFSQFVDHLAIVREMLDRQKIGYQYLDGSTPVASRKKAVDNFQAGKGDLFLISLKAGGFGLNLTAADYVIHLDPWWNPAVEDQASDRAHRIGQLRPVTVYRLVTSKTIEEKIVQLHGRKRDLADGLLDGTDLAGKISTDDLLQLLKSEH